jgi:3-oxoacyl-[acyl-carrier-protein] synthase II
MEGALRRGAPLYGEIIGYGSTADAFHITKPSLEGQSRAIFEALGDARIPPETVDYINAHGTATQWNDLLETQAVKKVFGDYAYKIPISSTKSMHGHTIGAAGAPLNSLFHFLPSSIRLSPRRSTLISLTRSVISTTCRTSAAKMSG